MAELVPPTPENVARAAAALGRGELVGMPTETVYGLAANALDAAAAARIFAAKERPTFDPLIVHVPASTLAALEAAGLVDLAPLSATARALGERLVAALWPGPLTLVVPRGPKVPDLVTSGLATVAVRAPRHPVAQALLAACGLPLAAPSANRFGRISPTSARDVAAELGGRVGLVLDGGPSEIGVESTVVALSPDGALTLLRPGGAPREALEALAGRSLATPAPGGPLAAPGMLASHYAPRTPLLVLPAAIASLRGAPSPLPPGPIALLAFSGEAIDAARRFEGETGRRPLTTLVLSARGELAEAARNLFASLRALDGSGAALIVAEPCPSDVGLGHAIRDRLARAGAR